MVDLHSEDAVINHYADRYRNLMPLNPRKVSRQKSSDNVWDETLPLVTTEVVSRDNALGALVGLPLAMPSGQRLNLKHGIAKTLVICRVVVPSCYTRVNGQTTHPWLCVWQKPILPKIE